jgi:hypothetical protein
VTPAIPAFDSLYYSGSSIYENDVTAAINHCESIGYAEKDIVIDTVLSGPSTISHFDMTGVNSFQIMERSASMWKYYERVRGILSARVAHSEVNFRHVIGPTYVLPNKIIPTMFTRDETVAYLEHGERDAERLIQNLTKNPEQEIAARVGSSYGTVY